MKRIYKYATGDSPPEGAVYLSTVTQMAEWVDAIGIGKPRLILNTYSLERMVVCQT